MSNNILVINSGSSSIKFALLDPESGTVALTGLAEKLAENKPVIHWHQNNSTQTDELPAKADHSKAMNKIASILQQDPELFNSIQGVGHRVVHGGEAFTSSSIINPKVLEEIKKCIKLAPLHNPVNLLGIEAAMQLFPKLAHAAVFDTSFHQTMPKKHFLYALPYEWYEKYSVRRYGFHGTSHRYVCEQAIERLKLKSDNNALISVHLGNGCSVAAILNGKSVDTTMGMTPLEGLVMGTRSGDIDPGVHAYIQSQTNLSLEDITNILNKKSGLLGISKISNDMRQLLETEMAGDEQAKLALDIYCYRIACAVGRLMVALGKLDALIFTGGVGENATLIRARVVNQLKYLGLKLDESLNNEQGKSEQGRITSSTSPCAMVIKTNEELVIAKDTLAILNKNK